MSVLLSACIHSKQLEEWPPTSCAENDVELNMKHLKFCADADDLHKIEFLSLGENQETLVLHEDNGDIEFSIALNMPEISIGNLHKKNAISVNEFFIALLNDNSEVIQQLPKVKQAFELNAQNKMRAYKLDNLYAFTIDSEVKSLDVIYINKKDSEYVYQINGEFTEQSVGEILSRISYREF